MESLNRSVQPITAVKHASIKFRSGNYQIHIEAPGFKALDIEGVNLTAGPHRKEITLEIDVIKVDVDVADEAQVQKHKSKWAGIQ